MTDEELLWIILLIVLGFIAILFITGIFAILHSKDDDIDDVDPDGYY